MSLENVHTISRTLCFDNRDDRPARRQRDKLATIRTVWDKWVHRLPLFYKPGPYVTIDEPLIPFSGRCPVQQCMPSKPAKSGIKIKAASDFTSSYGAPEKSHEMRVVLNMTQGLSGHNIRCDFF